MKSFANIGDKNSFFLFTSDPFICVQLLRGKPDLTRWNLSQALWKLSTLWNLFHRYLVENVNMSFYCAGLRSNGGQVLTFYTFWRKNQITINLCI